MRIGEIASGVLLELFERSCADQSWRHLFSGGDRPNFPDRYHLQLLYKRTTRGDARVGLLRRHHLLCRRLFGSRGQFALLQSRQPALQIARSGFLVLSISGLFVSLTYLPIAEATAIGFIGPLFITILSVPFLGERVGRHRWLAVMIGLAGVLVIARPGGAVWHWSAIMKARLAIVRRELQSIAGYVVRPPVGLGSE
ncbi:MAG: multidrug transporter EmrE-like cation transporter [Hyphomicrobiaceae bacterium]|jgi:multidrug transporter EmrE-like cation transporter